MHVTIAVRWIATLKNSKKMNLPFTFILPQYDMSTAENKMYV